LAPKCASVSLGAINEAVRLSLRSALEMASKRPGKRYWIVGLRPEPAPLRTPLHSLPPESEPGHNRAQRGRSGCPRRELAQPWPPSGEILVADGGDGVDDDPYDHRAPKTRVRASRFLQHPPRAFATSGASPRCWRARIGRSIGLRHGDRRLGASPSEPVRAVALWNGQSGSMNHEEGGRLCRV
jgi:hypothetical protein